MRTLNRRAVLALSVAFGMTGLGGVAQAQESVEEFYSGRTMEMVIGYTPGGAYDLYARLVAQHLPRFIPGNPDIVPQNMPGGGSRTAMNYLVNVAPQDGSVLATGDQGLALYQAMGDDTLGFDVRDINFIGNTISANNVLAAWHTSGVETIEQATETPLTVGSTGSSTSLQYPAVLNSVVGTQFEIIVGYQGGNDINFAMENGEVDARGSNSWASYKAGNSQWIEDGLLNVLVQIGLTPEPDLPDVPLLIDLAENEEDEAMLRLLSTPPTIGRPIMAGPDVPEDRLQALRDAFDAMIADPEFLEAAAAQGLDINPLSGAELQDIVADILATPPEVGQRLAEVGESITQ